MTSTRRHHLALPLGLAAFVLATATACNHWTGIEGSGIAETTIFNLDDFDEIEVSGAFVVELSVEDGPTTVEVTIDDNLVEHLEVDVDDGRLTIGMDGTSFHTRTAPTAVVSMPRLSEVDVHGASQLTASGVDTGEDLSVEVGGASQAAIDGRFAKLEVEAGEASFVVLTGDAESSSLDAGGASSIDLGGLSTGAVDVDLRGASSVEVGQATRADGELSDASHLSVPAEVSGSISVSGASSVERR